MRLSELIIKNLPLEKVLEVYGLPEMAVGDVKEISQEDWNEAIRLMKEHNDAASIDKEIKGFYYIDVTGRYQVYFTLWRWKDIDPKVAQWIKNPIYMGNMTTNFLASVKKALDKIPRTVRFQIMTEENREGLIGKNAARSNEDIKFTFGKYRGRSLGEVYLEDPRYITWLVQNQDPKYANTKLSMALQLFANMYYEEVTKQNQAKYKDVQYVGAVGAPYEGEIEVYKIETKAGQNFAPRSRWGRQEDPTYTDARAVDAAGNKFIIYNLDKAFPNHIIEKGTKVKIKGKVKEQREILGIKFNRLSYVKAIDPGNARPKEQPQQTQPQAQPQVPQETPPPETPNPVSPVNPTSQDQPEF